MIGPDLSPFGLLVGIASAIGSMWLGRRLARRWRAEREAKVQIQRESNESRQVRRARERAQSKQ